MTSIDANSVNSGLAGAIGRLMKLGRLICPRGVWALYPFEILTSASALDRQPDQNSPISSQRERDVMVSLRLGFTQRIAKCCPLEHIHLLRRCRARHLRCRARGSSLPQAPVLPVYPRAPVESDAHSPLRRVSILLLPFLLIVSTAPYRTTTASNLAP